MIPRDGIARRRKGGTLRNQQSSVREALLWEDAGEAVRCLTCERRCVLKPGQTGWCGTRVNQGGTLYTVIYGLVSSLTANPIEKKPLCHFYPGTLALTSGAWSCNFNCPWCQNHHISKVPPRSGRTMSPSEFVSVAVEWRCQGTSISLNEPTLSLEWSLEVFRLAHAQGLYNTYVTNGYMTPQALRLLAEAGLDAMNVDVKGDAQAVRRYCHADVEKVWRNCCQARQLGIHLELTTLVIPGVNDRDEVLTGIAERIVSDLGPDVPWHVTGYYPAYQFSTPPTPMRTLDRAAEIGKGAALRWVYVGNVPGHRLGNTYCPDCRALLIERSGLRVKAYCLDGGHCPGCGRWVPGVWGGSHHPEGN